MNKKKKPEALSDLCAEAFKILDLSATFAMSLGAKELFHSNFLAFILETDDEALDLLRRHVRESIGLPVNDNELSTCAVWREKHHLDLVILPLEQGEEGSWQLSKKRALVLEAKLKGLPTIKQLRDYNTRIAKGLKLGFPDEESPEEIAFVGGKPSKKCPEPITPKTVLLSPSSGIVLDGWEPRTWLGVAEAIKSALGNKRDTTLLHIINDYTEALFALLEIIGIALGDFETRWNERHRSRYIDLYRSLTAPAFSNRRLQDLVSKVVFDAWIRKEVALLVSRVTPNHNIRFSHYVHYSNRQPGLGFEYSIQYGAKGSLKVGVQIQGAEYRHFISVAEPESGLEAFVLQDKGLWNWLNQSVAGRPLVGLGKSKPAPIPAKKGRRTNLRVFDVKKFVFSAVEVDNMTLGQLDVELTASLQLASQLVADIDISKLA